MIDARLAPLLNAPYITGGRDIAADGGIDCWGLVCACYQRLGIAILPPFVISDNELRRSTFAGAMESEQWQHERRPSNYSVTMFKLNNGNWHCGVLLPDKFSFIHASKPVVAIGRLDTGLWCRSFKGFYRYVK